MDLTSFKILFGCPLLLVKGLKGDLKEIGDLILTQQIQALGLTLEKSMTGLERDSLLFSQLLHTLINQGTLFG
jgi:hypothetical protein